MVAVVFIGLEAAGFKFHDQCVYDPLYSYVVAYAAVGSLPYLCRC